MEYNEDNVLTDYVWSHGQKYMTELELLGQKTVHMRSKVKSPRPAIARKILEESGVENDPRVNEALSQGVKKFKETVRDRVLHDHPEIINRCPKCNRVVRTPVAKQCNWCFNDWH